MLPKELVRFKELGKQITILTAWDSISSAIVQAAGADAVLVGDSLAMFVHGHTTFLSYQCGTDKAVAAAGGLIKNSSVSAVKIEGAEPEVLLVIERLVRMGIPVMGHLGLTPQSVKNLGYHRQAEDKLSQKKLINQALELEKNGCFSLVLEHVPSEVASQLKDMMTIPIIGIGAGQNCDGQIRVTADLLGLTEKQPPFAKPLIDTRNLCIKALQSWVLEQHI